MLPRFGRLVIAGLAVCAIATPAMSQPRSRMRIALPAFGAQVVMDTIGEVQEVVAPPIKVFLAASMVLANLRIAIDVSDSLTGLVGAAKLTRSRNLGGRGYRLGADGGWPEIALAEIGFPFSSITTCTETTPAARTAFAAAGYSGGGSEIALPLSTPTFDWLGAAGGKTTQRVSPTKW